jgi:hypothetical protein
MYNQANVWEIKACLGYMARHCQSYPNAGESAEYLLYTAKALNSYPALQNNQWMKPNKNTKALDILHCGDTHSQQRLEKVFGMYCTLWGGYTSGQKR